MPKTQEVPKHCVNRQSQALARIKAYLLDEVITHYAAEEDDRLQWLTPKHFAGLSEEREHRDELIRAGYRNPHSLQIRMWKLAWKDTYEQKATAIPVRKGGEVQRNRREDRFICLYCGWAGRSDWVGTYHLQNRMDDLRAPLWMPRGQVKKVALHGLV